MYTCVIKQIDIAAKLLTRIREALGSNLGRHTDYPDTVYVSLSLI
jgi:hypothetical protein